MPGLHLTADLYRCRCDAAWLGDAERLGDWCMEAVRAVGLQPEDRLFRVAAAPGGVTGAVLLAHAHVAVHTWPRERSAALDVYLGEAADTQPAQARAGCVGEQACGLFGHGQGPARQGRWGGVGMSAAPQ